MTAGMEYFQGRNRHSENTLTVSGNLHYSRQSKSAPNSRCASFKIKSSKKNGTLDQARKSLPGRVESLLPISRSTPSIEAESAVRIRTFKMTSRGIENRGDAFRSTDGSLTSIGSPPLSPASSQRRKTATYDQNCGQFNFSQCEYYRVPILGLSGVGKTALATQFKTSECINDDDFADKNLVHVELDGQESILDFQYESEHFQCLEDDNLNVNADAFIVVFSVNSQESFEVAKNTVDSLRNILDTDRAIIMVANKVDLVRKRTVHFEEAKEVAEEHNCKYIETSVSLNHNIDEVLVCILRQIRLMLNPDITELNSLSVTQTKRKRKHKGRLELFNRLFNLNNKICYSCENLYHL